MSPVTLPLYGAPKLVVLCPRRRDGLFTHGLLRDPQVFAEERLFQVTPVLEIVRRWRR